MLFCLATWLALLGPSLTGALSVGRRVPVQVVVDIDDSVKSSGNVRLLDIPLGGIDGQYDRGAFYPGVCDFAAELSAAHSASSPEPVAVLTARAKEFKFALELNARDAVVKAFRACGEARGMTGWGVAFDRVLYGSVHEWVFQDFKGWRKFLNFEILARRLGDLDTQGSPSRQCAPVSSTRGTLNRPNEVAARVGTYSSATRANSTARPAN